MGEASPNLDIIEQISEKRRAGALVEAERLCRKALSLHPENTTLILMLGQIAAECGRFADAMNCYRWAEGAGLDSPELYLSIGEACQTLQWREQAEIALRRYMEWDPYDQTVWTRLGVTLSQLGKHVEAVLLLREKANRFGGAENFFNWGQALISAGRYEEAVAPLTRAIEQDDRLAPIHFSLGKTLHLLGRRAEAAAALRRGLDIDPENESVKRALAELADGE